MVKRGDFLEDLQQYELSWDKLNPLPIRYNTLWNGKQTANKQTHVNPLFCPDKQHHSNSNPLMLVLFSLVFAAAVLARCPCPSDCGPADDCTLCKVNGVSRLSRDRCSSSCFIETRNTLIFVQPPCRLDLPTGKVIGELICRESVCKLSPLETRLIREADEKCSWLSPISFRFDQGIPSMCQSYLRNKGADEGCKKGFKAYCVYSQVKDDLGVQPVIKADSVYKLSEKQLVEIETAPFGPSGLKCPSIRGQAAFASWCISPQETPVPATADLASLMVQNFACPCDSLKQIINNAVGCYNSVEGPKGACAEGQVATCFYSVSK